MNEKKVSSSLRLMRIEAHLTLDEVAFRSNFSKWTIINWESGRRSPKVEDLKTYISTVFGLSLEQFFIVNPTPTPPIAAKVAGISEQAS